MRRLRHLTNRLRAPSTNRALGLLLAFNAGAVNAGGFLVLHMYTSHMTGFASQLPDSLFPTNAKLALNALGAILVNWGRQHRMHSVYALPLLLEALLMFPFGLIGAVTLTWSPPFAVPLTVLLLSFVMGLQNAVGSKTSGGSIRTTHMTGNIIDLGMELGKALFLMRSQAMPSQRVQHDWPRMQTAAGLLAMFVLGGFAGALGFKHAGFVCVVPLAALLLAISVPPLLRDIPRSKALLALWRR